MSRPGAFASALVAAALAGGCTTVTPIDLGGSGHVAGWNTATRDYAVENWLYAQLAINVYADNEAFILPGNIVQRPFLLENDVTRETSGNDGVGYSYAIFDRYDDEGTLTETIIAYRGTEQEGLPLTTDIVHGNILGQQHDRGRETANVVYLEMQQGPEGRPELTVTGHSLGGGIAHHVTDYDDAESGTRVTRSRVFNNAPRFAGLEPNSVDRSALVERGDFLGVARAIGTAPRDLHLSIDCRSGVNGAENHSMRKLAECLTWIAAYDDEAARLSLAQNPVVSAPPVQTDPREPEAAAGLQGTGVPVNVYTDSAEMRIALDAAFLASPDLAPYDIDRTGYRLHVEETQTAQLYHVEWRRNGIVVQNGLNNEPVSRQVDCRSLSLSECAEEIIAPAERLIAFQLANVACRDLPKVPLSPANRERCGLGELQGLPDGT